MPTGISRVYHYRRFGSVVNLDKLAINMTTCRAQDLNRSLAKNLTKSQNERQIAVLARCVHMHHRH